MTIETIAAGLGIGGCTGATLFVAEVAITGGTTVPLGAAASVAVSVCGMVWWMGRKFQKLEDGQKAAREHFELIDARFDNLRCMEGVCQPKSKVSPKHKSDSTT